ncbi:uncharacterized protein L201_006522 [Kwoniella dendrophila CBS 6074]|uniref:Myosin-binding domain-containing protein n=1 Tax=Kwoniella dendrophila CBS 6074 TaxID=1295534 RepID=A0AAX4K1H0_9TREE
MATSFVDSGPLYDYFRDESDQRDHPHEQVMQGQKLDLEMEMEMETRRNSGLSEESGNTTLVTQSSISPTKGWTGSLPNAAGPSSIASNVELTSNDNVPGKFPSPTRLTFSDETFAEKFKYLICSSGLLEKDYIPALSGGLESELGEELNSADHSLNQYKVWIERAKQRWDLVLAGIALLLGLTISLGVWTILGLGMITVIGLAMYKGIIPIYPKARNDKASASSDVDCPKTLALASLTNFISQSHSLNLTLSSSISILEPQTYNLHVHNTLRVALHRLTGNMTDHFATATSTLLELTDRRELSVLGEMYDIPVVGSFFYSRRNRNVSDASSEEESEKQGAHQDSKSQLPQQRPGLPHRPSSNPSPVKGSKHTSGHSTSSLPAYESSSPLKKLHTCTERSNRFSLGSSPELGDKFTQIPDRTPRLSKRASVERLRDTWSQSPRFERPKHERRITEADEEEQEDNQEEEEEANDSSISSDQSMSSDDSTPMKVEKKNSTIDVDVGAVLVSPKSPQSRNGLGVTIPRTPILTQNTPRRSSTSFKHVPSPLSRRPSNASERLLPLRTAISATPSRSAPNTTSLLPSPFVNDRETHHLSSDVPLSSAPLRAALSLDPDLNTATANPKRRSLQNIPYYHSSDDEHHYQQSLDSALSSSGLTRTRSMPLSDIQALRSALTIGGSKSRRSSIAVNPGLGIGIGYPSSFPTDKRSSWGSIQSSSSPDPSLSAGLRRIESVSPLTTPSLKASCLGIHLKRRRLACCLLGLKFIAKSDNADAYWENVKLILDELNENIKEEKEIIENVLRDAEKENDIVKSLNAFGTKDKNRNSMNMSDLGDSLWSPSTSVFPFTTTNPTKDFAPRTSDEALLVDNIDKLSNALVGAWKDLSSIKEILKTRENGVGIGIENWSEIRNKLGEGIREWERGKEVLLRMDTSDETIDQDKSPEEEEEESSNVKMKDLPEFMQSWQDEQVEQSSDLHSLDILQNEQEDYQTTNNHEQRGDSELLPPVGKDMIFESTMTDLPALSEEKQILSKLTREERIKLSKESREKGISLKQLLNQKSDPDTALTEESKRQMKLTGGEVVNELKGIIGSIRRLKEGGDSTDNPEQVHNKPDDAQHMENSHIPLEVNMKANDNDMEYTRLEETDEQTNKLHRKGVAGDDQLSTSKSKGHDDAQESMNMNDMIYNNDDKHDHQDTVFSDNGHDNNDDSQDLNDELRIQIQQRMNRSSFQQLDLGELRRNLPTRLKDREENDNRHILE